MCTVGTVVAMLMMMTMIVVLGARVIRIVWRSQVAYRRDILYRSVHAGSIGDSRPCHNFLRYRLSTTHHHHHHNCSQQQPFIGTFAHTNMSKYVRNVLSVFYTKFASILGQWRGGGDNCTISHTSFSAFSAYNRMHPRVRQFYWPTSF